MQLTLPGGEHRNSLARSLPAYEKAALPRSSDLRLPRTTASSTNNADYTRRRIRWEIDENRRRKPSYHRKSWSGLRNSQYGAAPISASDVDGELHAQRQRHPHPDSAGNRRPLLLVLGRTSARARSGTIRTDRTASKRVLRWTQGIQALFSRWDRIISYARMLDRFLFGET
jgi:hypothetical protein